MTSPYRLASIAIALAGFSSAAHPEYLIDFYIPQYPAHFAPIGSASQPVMVRAYGNGYPLVAPAQVRIDATCGQFADGSTSMIGETDGDGWVSDQWSWRAPAVEQDCAMNFTQVGGAVTFSLPVHVLDPATVMMTTDFGDSLETQAARPFVMTLAFFTSAGLPISNSTVIPMVSKTQGASAGSLYVSFPTTTVDGIQYVSGLANNAVGEYDIIIDLAGGRWSIPVYQGTPLPGSRKHWGRM